jgi:hypothetical protein
LNSVAPSGGVGAGSGICAPATCVTSNATENPSPIAHVPRSFVMHITVGVLRL